MECTNDLGGVLDQKFGTKTKSIGRLNYRLFQRVEEKHNRYMMHGRKQDVKCGKLSNYQGFVPALPIDHIFGPACYHTNL